MADLFDGAPDAPPAPASPPVDVEHPAPVDVMNRIAARKAGGKPGWRWCSSEVVGRPPHGTPRDQVHFLIEGAVPVGVWASGERKGRPRWPKREACDRVVVTGAEVDAEVLAVEAETGKCHPCVGTGRERYGFKTDADGKHVTLVRGCARCNATGRPPASWRASLRA
jgi:hypothetical protein